MVFIRELLFENKVIGYRVIKSDICAFDMPCDLFYDMCETYKGKLSMRIGNPFECILEGDLYIVKGLERCVRSIENKEVLTEVIDGLLSSDNDVKQSIAMYRYFVCANKLRDLGIPIGKVTELVINGRFSSSWGVCKKSRVSNSFKIELSDRLFLSSNGYGSLDNTIIHELLHTVPNCLNHGSEWKYYAKLVNIFLGFDITKNSSTEEKCIDTDKLKAEGYYLCQCMDCGNIVSKKTMCNFIKHYEDYSCGLCGGRFTRIS